MKAGILADHLTKAQRQRAGARLSAAHDKLIRQRLELGWSRAEIAKALGVGKATIDRRADMWGFTKNPRPLVGDENLPYPFPIPYGGLEPAPRKAIAPTAAGFKLFHEHYLGLHFDPWADQLAELLVTALSTQEKEFLLVNAPPGAGKTTALTYAFVLWVIVMERAHGRWFTSSLGHREEGKAKWYVQRIRSALETNPKLQTDYGFFRPKGAGRRWSGSELDVEPLDWSKVSDKEPTVTAGSYMGSTLSGRYDLSIWDDLIDAQNSSTIEQRKKLERWNDIEAETRVEPGGLFVLSGARYGPEDLFHMLLTAKDPEEIDAETGAAKAMYHHVAYSAHYDELCTGNHPGEPWPKGCLLSPDRISWKTLTHHRSKDDSRYELVWQNHDSDPAGSLANPLWFTGGVETATGIQYPGCFEERLFGVRPKELEKKVPDVSACAVDPGPSRYWAIEHWLAYDEMQYLYNARRPVMAAPELLYRENDGTYTGVLEELWQEGREHGLAYTYLIVEINTAQKWLLQYPFVNEWAIARGVTIVRHTTGVNRADPERGVEMLRPIYKKGQARIPYGGHEEKLFADQLKREACAWPEGSSTDLVMAHWFFNAKLPTLLTNKVLDSIDAQAAQVPAFVGASGGFGAVPAFARR